VAQDGEDALVGDHEDETWMAGANQKKTASVNPSHISRPERKARRSEVTPSSAASHGTKPIQPSRNVGPSTRT
jgi:hypothetical protein